MAWRRRARPARLWTHQLQLTLADLVGEVHDTHHPDRGEPVLRGSAPRSETAAPPTSSRTGLPKFFRYFEHVLVSNPSGPTHLVGARLTCADLSLFQVVAGLHYAFPKAMARTAKRYPHVLALHERVAARPRIGAYLASERRLPFNQQGLFRHYAELDPRHRQHLPKDLVFRSGPLGRRRRPRCAIPGSRTECLDT